MTKLHSSVASVTPRTARSVQKITQAKLMAQAVSFASLSACLVAPAQAQSVGLDSNAGASIKPAQIVVISGTRYEQFVENLPMAIDVIDQKEIERLGISDIRDLAKNLANVEVKRAPARFTVTGVGNSTGRDGNAGFAIRGQDGNRVLMLIDGMRLPRSYINGSNAFGRDSIAMNLIRQAEIVRGPASVLYGSDGLAGLVNFMTLEPQDFLQEKNAAPKDFGGKLFANWSGDDHSRSLGASLAGRINPQWSWLISANASKAKGLENMGTNDVPNIDRTTPNPQDDKTQSVLAKLVYQPSSTQKHSLSVEHIDKISDFELLSSRAKLPMTTASAVKGETVHKESTRDRLTLTDRYTLNNGWVDHVQSNLSYQDSSAQDDGVTHRNTLADRVRKVSYAEQAWQFSVLADKLFKSSSDLAQRLSYGFDYSRIDVSNFFDGVDPGNADFTPRKYFPDTRDSSRAVFVQDEIFAGSWIITPGLRYDHFDLDVKTQDGFAPPAKTPAKSLSGSAVVPKLGVLYKVNADWNAYANLAGGFRAPNAQQINGVFDSSTVPAVLLANPDLKPEKSQNVELGVRALFEKFNLDVAVFSGRYTDLIYDKKPLGGKGIAGDPAIFQTVNVDKAKIDGFEIRGQVQWAEFAGGQWSSPFSYGKTRGTDQVAHTPLSVINPSKFFAGLRYTTDRVDWQLNARHQAGKDEADLSSPYLLKPAVPPRVRQFLVPSVTTLDMQLQWTMQKNWRLNVGVDNLTNKKFWNWSDVQGLAANSVVVDAYTQPGRYYHASLVVGF
ncbi:TonB-dependent hemoglobin/transferrin/lactoferrin family receptor [Undibacterium danionis]|uniref:TonB-dependent hemoglobin/transferrin/lactoferrin family receptor n=1 Tax=Undibacterium danionis TaxID=1812100 RepID=A0ABV6IE66_9BURK